uniref:Uncharacterized protein n=1 Tax=Anguilla anguilla TaxID=7936 RepID=A0A0E9QBN9_ANGAN
MLPNVLCPGFAFGGSSYVMVLSSRELIEGCRVLRMDFPLG